MKLILLAGLAALILGCTAYADSLARYAVGDQVRAKHPDSETVHEGEITNVTFNASWFYEITERDGTVGRGWPEAWILGEVEGDHSFVGTDRSLQLVAGDGTVLQTWLYGPAMQGTGRATAIIGPEPAFDTLGLSNSIILPPDGALEFSTGDGSSPLMGMFVHPVSNQLWIGDAKGKGNNHLKGIVFQVGDAGGIFQLHDDGRIVMAGKALLPHGTAPEILWHDGQVFAYEEDGKGKLDIRLNGTTYTFEGVVKP